MYFTYQEIIDKINVLIPLARELRQKIENLQPIKNSYELIISEIQENETDYVNLLSIVEKYYKLQDEINNLETELDQKIVDIENGIIPGSKFWINKDGLNIGIFHEDRGLLACSYSILAYKANNINTFPLKQELMRL